MKNFIKEFKEFIATGSLIETAVALVIGLKVKDVIDQFMTGVVNPFIAGVVGKQNFNDVLSFHLGTAQQYDDKGAPIAGAKGAVVQPGLMITALINLILVGLVLFIILKSYNKMKNRRAAEAAIEAAADPVVSTEVELLTEIRDALRVRG
jgi:large conductance mechanosensitive channel